MKKLVVSKRSKYEWERKTLNLSHDELIKKYQKERANLDAILKGHDKQLDVRDQIKHFLPNADFKMMDDVNSEITKYDLVIILGGDNSVTKISHYVDKIPIIGVNSDPDRSVGCVNRWAIHREQDVLDFVEMLDFHEYDIESWPRLEATLDGTQIVPATSEYYFGERMRNRMSRHILIYRGQEYEQKCSGIIVATGAGSTGWYQSISSNLPWKPTRNRAAFVVSEPYRPRHNGCYVGDINPDETVILYSLNDDGGLASSDSWDNFSFSRGTKAEIKIGQPLNVLVPRK